MARIRKKTASNTRTDKKTPQKKQNKVILSISQVFRNLSISVNLTVYAIYLIYLIYSILADVGVKLINIALAIVTAAFMLVYLVLRLSAKKRGKQLKAIKHYYRNFKLVARNVSAVTAIYALITAVEAVSPFAIIVSSLGAVFLIIRIIVELILGFIKRRIRKLRASIAGKGGAEAESEDYEYPEEEPKRKKKRSLFASRRKGKDDLEDIIIPVDRCLLNDIDD